MSESILAHKVCTGCNETKPVSDYHRNNRLEGGYNHRCKLCIKAYQTANRDAIRAKQKEYWEANSQTLLAKRKAERDADPEAHRAYKREWNKKNREAVNKAKRLRRACAMEKAKQREYMAQWREAKKDHLREVEKKRYHLIRKFDVKYKLNRNLNNQIHKSLKKKGAIKTKSWEKALGYTVHELEARLKETMPKGYGWDDYLTGALHIDHIIPVAVHNFQSMEDADFKRCWSLKNLRLLPKLDNILKRDKIDAPFQPSLTGI